ncbi:hypothetical protein F7725_021008 [Dissostichus mawsoni]|uniref:Uncharacterized protein n=1 Tax=Dissostichus mawsoni TaxID=36200 RepID=A0A7J5YEY5_DISMA|nr:hypothetical protein F7725_021008 [Dissostichus mawsoni]
MSVDWPLSWMSNSCPQSVKAVFTPNTTRKDTDSSHRYLAQHPQGGHPRPCPSPLRNHRAEKAATVEDQEKTTLMHPTVHRPMEKSQRALIWSESTPLMNLLIA